MYLLRVKLSVTSYLTGFCCVTSSRFNKLKPNRSSFWGLSTKNNYSYVGKVSTWIKL